ncbi:hypothetical protein BK816_08375 [Boudabousia tangfeifanii]|uniref:Sensor-like histidine kinase SenX3 n=1 Tax=Boudabousia tangfeifanii TaxID=1912795 RepID=A0A1D9MMC1_9ACTO|nr:ATP-binding protein [Boudabousia tangfeifanii]AOZ73290.1 hypothetical protein BK816_08375 [Boudabousia tangfeifanii]
MEQTVILLVIVGLLGLLVGAVGVGAAWASEKAHQPKPKPEKPEEQTLSPEVLSMLAAVPYVSIVLDPQDRVVRADANGYAYGLVSGEELVHPELKEAVAKLRRDGKVTEQEYELHRSALAGTEHFPAMVRLAPLRRGYVLLLAEDVSGPQRLEATRRDFTANISHELKTPVGAISLLAETLASHPDNPEAVAHFSGQLLKESARLTNLISDIIDLSRLQAPGVLEAPKVVNIDQVIGQAVEASALTGKANGIEIVVGQPSNAMVLGDFDLLTTAVRNLLDNAIRYSEPNTKVSVAATLEDDLVRINVVDQGIGIAPEEQERIFERFYRVDPGRSRAKGGTGLGLSIVKHVAAKHGGTVSVWSRLGRGASFTLVLPAAPQTLTGEAGTVTEAGDQHPAVEDEAASALGQHETDE